MSDDNLSYTNIFGTITLDFNKLKLLIKLFSINISD